MDWLEKKPLEGRIIRLEPMEECHEKSLAIAGRDPSIWKYMLYGVPITEESMHTWVQDILNRSKNGDEMPYVVVHLVSGNIVGATRYLEMRPEHKSLEIGGTWYAVEFQRTGVNTECKYLLLRNAFEKLECNRVQFKTDLRNIRSQQAIERLGAVKEGILRNHIITPEGVIRDSVYYSILAEEWKVVKENLESKLIEMSYQNNSADLEGMYSQGTG
jgi:RimJ/RimL family protein N-acetyltransferase